MFSQGFDESPRTPQKHSAVPEVAAGRNELSRSFRVRLLREATYIQCIALKQSSRLDVTVAGFRAVRPYAEHHDMRAGCSQLNPALERLAVAFLIRDYVIGRKHSNDCVGIFPHKKKCHQPDRRSSIASHWLGEQLRLG